MKFCSLLGTCCGNLLAAYLIFLSPFLLAAFILRETIKNQRLNSHHLVYEGDQLHCYKTEGFWEIDAAWKPRSKPTFCQFRQRDFRHVAQSSRQDLLEVRGEGKEDIFQGQSGSSQRREGPWASSALQTHWNPKEISRLFCPHSFLEFWLTTRWNHTVKSPMPWKL